VSVAEPATVHEPTRRKRRRPRLSDEAAAHVRELIISGQLSVGEFIRPETVAQELDISAKRGGRASSRCRARASSRCNPGAGFLVSPLSAQDIHDTFAAQALLAGELAARAAVVANPVDVQALETLQTDLDAAAEGGDYYRVEQLNFEFHRTIYRLACAPRSAGCSARRCAMPRENSSPRCRVGRRPRPTITTPCSPRWATSTARRLGRR